MNFIPRWLGGGLRRQPGLQNNAPLQTFAGKTQNVTEETALQISAVWAAVNLKAGTIASLTLDFYDTRGDDRVKLKPDDHYLPKLFSGKINGYQSRMEFFETVGLNLYLTGNAYCLINRVQGQVVGLMPIMSSQVEVRMLDDGSMVYTYTNGKDVTVYAAENIWHIKLMSNGVQGLSPLQYARNSVGMAISGEEWGNNIISNGGKPTGVLTYDKTLKQDQRDQLKESFRELREGSRDALMVLEAGFQYQQISLSPQDVQLLAARRFQVEDIARFFDVPSVMINDTSGSTTWGSGIQEIIRGWYKLSLRKELERIEQSIIISLLPAEQRQYISVEFNFDELLRTEFENRVEAGARAVNAGLMTRDEWRKREWLPAKGGSADELTVQVNMIGIDDLEKVVGGYTNAN
jgi:HK97 family phage portal protein